SCKRRRIKANQTGKYFISSRRRHTRFSRDWSSDVCSSDLAIAGPSRSKEYTRRVCAAVFTTCTCQLRRVTSGGWATATKLPNELTAIIGLAQNGMPIETGGPFGRSNCFAQGARKYSIKVRAPTPAEVTTIVLCPPGLTVPR